MFIFMIISNILGIAVSVLIILFFVYKLTGRNYLMEWYNNYKRTGNPWNYGDKGDKNDSQ